MTRSAPAEQVQPREPDIVPGKREAYEELLARALRHARRLLPPEQAFEVAHDVALEMLRRPPGPIGGGLLYVAVTARLRIAAREAGRRATRDRAYLEMTSTSIPAWAQPGSELEAKELDERITAAVAEMPRAMRETFLLVREEELSYKDAAARLGVSVGTIHTQMSRALAVLRDCVERYESGAPASATKGGRP
jgi:RNA polymerase sigma-70 factor (ECF subfamily)